MIRQNNLMATAATPLPTPSAPSQPVTITPSQPAQLAARKQIDEEYTTAASTSQRSGGIYQSQQPSNSATPGSMMSSASAFGGASTYQKTQSIYSSNMAHHDDDSNSLHNMYGFKQAESGNNIQDVFKFLPATRNMLISESQFEHAQMQNGQIWVLTRRNHLIWKASADSIGDERNQRIMEVDEDVLKRKPIKKMYVDPRGQHCFLLAEHEVFYNNWSHNRVFQVPTGKADGTQTSQPKSFKSIDLQYVDPRDPSGLIEILLGTEDGQIFHTCLNFTQKGLDVIDPLRIAFETQIHRPILDIKAAKIAGNQIILAINDQSLFQFYSNRASNLKQTFNDYLQNPSLLREHTIRIDASSGSSNMRETTQLTGEDGNFNNDDITYNQLRLYTSNAGSMGPDDEPIVGGFGWMNEYGFYYASYSKPNEYIIKNKSLEQANFLRKEGDNLIENVVPLSFAITQFHIVYLYPKNVTVLSKISRQIVYSTKIEDQELLSGISLDQRKNKLIIYGKVPPLLIANLKGEDQDAWRYYLHREQFAQAIAACKTGKQKAFAAGYYADNLFAKEKYDLAADYYAQSDKTFEEVALKFLHANRYSDLIHYLERILKAIDPAREDLHPQRMLLYTWIVELKLNQINSLQALAATSNEADAKLTQEEIALKQKRFHEFLKEHAGSLGQAGHETVFQILQSHGKINECIRFAEDVGAHEAVIVHYINKQEYLRALEKVERIPDRATKNTVMLRYASVFIKNLPEQTIIALSKFEDIKVEKLVPAFMNIPRTPTGPGGKVLDMAKNFVIDYCINKRKSKDKTVHNLALYFYAERDKPDDLLAYLRQQEAAKEAGQNIFFEIDYALNVCKQKEKELSLQLEIKKKYGSLSNQASLQLQAQKEVADIEAMIPKFKKAQIILYAILGLFDKAVKLSLECKDIEMGKDYANKPSDKKLKKKLWMKIAKHLFNYQSKKAQAANKLGVKPIGTAVTGQAKPNQDIDVTRALEILKDSVLKIDDLLPLFPEDAKVEDMKKHLCECLDQYNSKILDLKQQLAEHSKSAEELRKKQRKQRHKHITINPQQECDLCSQSIFKHEFYVFPCLHAFHRECIYRQIKSYNSRDPQVEKKVQKLQKHFANIDNIRAKAAFVNAELMGGAQGGGGQSVFGRLAGAASGTQGGNMQYDDTQKNSLISDIKNYFTKSVRPGMPQSNQTQMLQQRDQQDIREILNQIDNILTQECFFCGSFLLDMIDNDVFNAPSKDLEFGSVNEDALQYVNQLEEEWRIR